MKTEGWIKFLGLHWTCTIKIVWGILTEHQSKLRQVKLNLFSRF